MKLNEMKAGEHYLSSRDTEWRVNGHRAIRVVVLSTERIVDSMPAYGYGSRTPSATMEFTHDGRTYTGNARPASLPGDRVDAVLVLPVNPETGAPVPSAKPIWVPLASVRGPWGPAWAAIQERKTAAEQARAVRDAARAAEGVRLSKAIDRLAAHGVELSADPHRLQVVLRAEALEQIANLLDA